MSAISIGTGKRVLPDHVVERINGVLVCLTAVVLLSLLLPWSVSLSSAATFQVRPQIPSIRKVEPSQNLDVIRKGLKPEQHDLVIRDVSMQDNTPSIGAIVRISATVVNLGRSSLNRVPVRFTYQGSSQEETITQLEPARGSVVITEIVIKGPPGEQHVDVIVNPVRKVVEENYANNQKRVSFRVQDDAQKISEGPPGMIVGLTGKTLRPDIVAIQPAILQQGGDFTLKTRGRNIQPWMRLEFEPGIEPTGITILGNDSDIPVRVAADCRPGEYGVTIVDKRQRYRATATFKVVAAPRVVIKAAVLAEPKEMTAKPVEPAVSMVVEPAMALMHPTRWQPGCDYQVTITGRYLDEVSAVSLGTGISVADVEHQGPNGLRLAIKVQEEATLGVRDVSFVKAGQEQRSGLKGFVIAVPHQLTKMPALRWTKTETPVQQGTIILESPTWRQQVDKTWVNHAAVLNDQTVFSWRETDPGLAEEFEVRFMTGDGTILLTKQIAIAPPASYQTSFKPSTEFIVELMQKLAEHLEQHVRGKLAGKSGGKKGAAQVMPSAASGLVTYQEASGPVGRFTEPSSGIIYHLSRPSFNLSRSELDEYFSDFGANILWQVVGTKQVSQQTPDSAPVTASTGASSTPGKGIKAKANGTESLEVEVSEKWPLIVSKTMPTGVTCDAANQFALTSDFEQPPGWDQEDQNLYPGTIIKISGSFSLQHSPWEISADTTYTQDDSIIADDAYHFNNVIIDWGDGQWQPLDTDAEKSELPGWSNQDVMKLSSNHQYDLPGTYQVRVYVVPQDQMDRVDAIVAANRYRPAPENASAAASVPILIAASDMTVSDGGGPALISGQAGFGVAQTIAMMDADIFMLYCNPLEVTIVQDTAATGPLNLKSLEIISFSTDEVPTSSEKTSLLLSNGSQQLSAGSTAVSATTGGQGTASKARSLSQKPVTPHVAAQGSVTSALPGITTVSTCSGGLWGKARLRYFGQGYIRVSWKVDGIVIDSRDYKIGPSALRKDLDVRDPGNWGEPNISDFTLPSPRLPVQDTGQHRVNVSAGVIADPTLSMVNAVSLRTTLSRAGRSDGKQKGGAAADGSSLIPAVIPPADGGLLMAPVPKQGNRTWRNQATSFADQLKQVQTRANFSIPPYFVIAPERRYLVQEYVGDAPCRFVFPTQEGDFEVADLQGVSSEGPMYRGNGLFIFKFPDGPHASSEYYLPLSFQSWRVPDKERVAEGSLDIQDSITMDTLPGMTAVLTNLNGTAGVHVNAVLDVTIKDPTVRLAGSESPQSWSGVTAPLSASGDWYAEGLSLGHSHIGWSLTTIESNDVRLDLSRAEGASPSCGAGGAAWVGINLGTSTLHPYMFHLQDRPIQVDGWSITDTGICGSATTGGFSQPFGDGEIGWGNLTIAAANGTVTTKYEGFFIEMAWPKIRLEGQNTNLTCTPGDTVDVQLDLSMPTVEEHYDTIDMKVIPRVFSHTEHGWGLQADTELTFRDEQGGGFASDVTVNDLFFTIYSGVIYPGSTIGLDIAGQLGGAEELISSLTVQAGGAGSSTKLAFDFTSQLSIEGLGTAEQPVHILYGITKNSGQAAQSDGPSHPGEVVFKSRYPDTNPMMTSDIKIVYQHGTGQSTAMGSSPLYAAVFNDNGMFSDAGYDYPLLAGEVSASGGGCGNDTFGGRVDSQLFGGQSPSVQGTFRFGNTDGAKYWLAYIKGDNLHIPIFVATYLEMVQGGLAYNFAHDAFTQAGGFNACPAAGKGLLFSSGMGISVGGGNVVRADGVLTIQKEEGFYQMEVDARLFQVANLSGRLRYWGSSFDGEIWGNVSLLNDIIYIEAPEHSVGIGMDSSRWYFHLGTDQNPVNGHLTSVLSGNAYMMLGSNEGFKVGTDTSMGINKTVAGFGFSGNVGVGGAVDLQLSPLRFDGKIAATASGKLINPVKDIGVSSGVDVWIGSQPKLGFGVSKSCCCVEAHVNVYVLPSPDIGGGASCTCCDPTDWF